MVHELSVGLVLVHYQESVQKPIRESLQEPLLDAGSRVLLLEHPQGHWYFPKGHVEPGETERKTAARELAEETSLDPARLRWVPGFRHRVDYSYRPGKGILRDKTVHYLAARTDEEKELVRLSPEHVAWEWLTFDEAIERLTFDTSKGVMSAFIDHLAGLVREAGPLV